MSITLLSTYGLTPRKPVCPLTPANQPGPPIVICQGLVVLTKGGTTFLVSTSLPPDCFTVGGPTAAVFSVWLVEVLLWSGASASKRLFPRIAGIGRSKNKRAAVSASNPQRRKCIPSFLPFLL